MEKSQARKQNRDVYCDLKLMRDVLDAIQCAIHKRKTLIPPKFNFYSLMLLLKIKANIEHKSHPRENVRKFHY